MRAYEYHGNRDLRLVETTAPELRPGEVMIKVAYTGICGTDLHEFYDGPLRLPTGPSDSGDIRFPPIIGHESSGTVVEIGPNVAGVAAGDRVTFNPSIGRARSTLRSGLSRQGHGSLGELVAVQAIAVLHLPSSVPLATGALTEPLAVALHGIKKVALRPEDPVIVFGAGPIGIGTLLLLRSRGVKQIIAVEPSPARARIVSELGFTVLDPSEAVESAPAVREAAPGGFAAAFDAAGVPGVLDQAGRLTTANGAIVVLAAYPRPVEVDLYALVVAERAIFGSARYNQEDFTEVITLLAANAIPTAGWVTKIPFTDAVVGGFEACHAGDAVKVLVEVGGES